MSDELSIRYVDLATLVRWDRNPKRHDLGGLATSIERHGFKSPPRYEPALNGGMGGIVAGNGRADALSAMKAQGRVAPRGIRVVDGAWYVPVLFGVDAYSQAAAEAYGLDDNNLTMAGGDFTDLDMAKLWDSDGYASLLEDLAQQDATPVSIDESALDALLAGLRDEEIEAGSGGDEFDATADQPTRCQSRDLWLIDGGRHRVFIGDATDEASVACVLADEKPFLMITDPPYGVQYDPVWRQARGLTQSGRFGTVANDDRADWRAAWDLFPGSIAYVWHADLHARQVVESLEASQFEIRAQIIWAKPQLVISRGHYHFQHEPCWYAVRHGANANWTGDRTQSTLWQISTVRQSGEDETLHSTQKPLDCMLRPMCNHGHRDAIVYDPFLGSGTTLIAAHRAGRRCFGLEIEPRYGDVILARAEAEGLLVELSTAT